MVSVVKFSDSLFISLSPSASSERVSGVEVDSTGPDVPSLPLTVPLWFPSHSASASMDFCFKDLVMLRLALPLLLIAPSGVRLLPIFVGDAGRFPLVFRVSPGFGVGSAGAL